jgi:hypothetical protein
MIFRVVLFLAFGHICQSALTEKATNGPVLVELYHESLCPYCKEFINDQLYPTFVKLADTG